MISDRLNYLRAEGLPYAVSLACLTRDQSNSKKLKVGSVVVPAQSETLFTGYNHILGNPLEDCEELGYSYERTVDWKYIESIILKTKSNIIRAERDAIMKASRSGISLVGGMMVVTSAPCAECAIDIIASGISVVYYLNEYKSKEGINLLKSNGVICTYYKTGERDD